MTHSPAFHRAQAAYLAPPAARDLDVPAEPVTAECTGLLPEGEADALEDDACDTDTCVHCEQVICDQHATDSTCRLFDGCEGKAHVACHDQSCRTPRDCFYEG